MNTENFGVTSQCFVITSTVLTYCAVPENEPCSVTKDNRYQSFQTTPKVLLRPRLLSTKSGISFEAGEMSAIVYYSHFFN